MSSSDGVRATPAATSAAGGPPRRPPRPARTGSGRGPRRARASALPAAVPYRSWCEQVFGRDPTGSGWPGEVPGVSWHPMAEQVAGRVERTRAGRAGREHLVQPGIVAGSPSATSPARRSVASGVPAYIAARPRGPIRSGGAAVPRAGGRAAGQGALPAADLQPPLPRVVRAYRVGQPERRMTAALAGKPRSAMAAGASTTRSIQASAPDSATSGSGQPVHRVGRPDERPDRADDRTNARPRSTTSRGWSGPRRPARGPPAVRRCRAATGRPASRPARGSRTGPRRRATAGRSPRHGGWGRCPAGPGARWSPGEDRRGIPRPAPAQPRLPAGSARPPPPPGPGGPGNAATAPGRPACRSRRPSPSPGTGRSTRSPGTARRAGSPARRSGRAGR